jgi:hypothetical protein
MSPKCWYQATGLHGAKPQKTTAKIYELQFFYVFGINHPHTKTKLNSMV